MQKLTLLQQLLTDSWLPASPEDFIGPSRGVARNLQAYVTLANAGGRTPLRIMLNGPPGIGKSALARYFQRLLFGGTCRRAHVEPSSASPTPDPSRWKWSTFKFSGVDVSVEKLRDLSDTFHLRDLFGGWRLIWIEEADRIPNAAQVRFLMLLDEMPDATAIICTSNCKISDFEQRFQTRFTFPEPFIQPPTGEEIEAFLIDKAGPHPGIKNVATFACGNVRAAINDTLDLCLRQPMTNDQCSMPNVQAA